MSAESIEKFDYENFDYEKCYNEVKESIKKPNILICGATGVGKSSLINDLLTLEDYKKAKVGNEGRPETAETKKYSSDEDSIVVYDSEGYELDTKEKVNDFENRVVGFIDKKKNENISDMSEWIHAVWYCVSAANKRFYDYDEKMIRAIKNKDVPIMVILTKVDMVSENDIIDLKKAISQAVNDICIFTYSTEIMPDNANYSKYVQKDEIVKWSLDNLDDSLKGGFISAVKGTIEQKRRYVMGKIIPIYVAAATAAVVTVSLTPIPFADSLPLMAIQTKMVMHIMKLYNIKSALGDTVKSVVGATVISAIGKKIAAALAGLIPGIGTAAKVAVNSTVAATITATLGCAIAYLSEQYLMACVDNGGSLDGFFSIENIKEAIDYVKNHPELFDIVSIINSSKDDK